MSHPETSQDVQMSMTAAGFTRNCGQKLAVVLAALLGAGSAAAQALPVIPNAVGFGMSTPAGRGGTVYRVTNLNETGSGSLKACIDASGPRVCVFEVSGTIRLTQDLTIRNSKITIAGQTAPSPGIMLRGAALRVLASDVLVQHLRVRPGDAASGPAPDNRDALKIEGTAAAPIKNVVIDHCSFSWSTDEIASVWRHWDNVTFHYSIFAEGLNDSLHSKGKHGYGIVFGPERGSVSMIGNLLAHAVERNPLSNAARLVMVNNVVYNWSKQAVDLQSQSGEPSLNSIVGNVFIRGPNYNADKPTVSLRAGVAAVPPGTKVFLSDNSAPESTSDPWSIAGASFGTLTLSGYKAATPPIWASSLTTMPTPQGVVLNHVLAHVGARPADRDAPDRRVIQEVKSRTGQIINCVAANGTERCKKNAGGWPTLAQNKRTLTLPSNPNTVTPSGYTNLELWLHTMSAQVEGRTGVLPVPPVLSANAP